MRMRFSAVAKAMAGRFRTGQRLGITAAIALLSGLPTDRVGAQGLPPADQLQQLIQQRQGNVTGTSQLAVSGTQTILEPAGPVANLPASRLEQIMSQRAGVKLNQFGYDQFGQGRAVSLPQVGAVQNDYILGPGDEIVVSLRGQENSEYRTTVDRDGRVLLPRLAPIPAAGRTFGDFRQDLLAAIHRAYVATEGYVSIGQLRQITVLVSGEVGNPGARIMTGLSTAADAVLISGGVRKTGSLRRVYILRGDKRISVDLYSVLTGQGSSTQVNLMDGDRIVVPPLGSTVAVAGWVGRPGIYELPPGQSRIFARGLLALAGGTLVRGKYRLSAMRAAADGRTELSVLSGMSDRLGGSDILFVQPGADQTASAATLSGGTPLAGLYVAKNTKLSELLKAPGAMGSNPYTLIGVISRRDPVTLLRKLIAFTPTAVLAGRDDMDVLNGDVVRVLAVRESALLGKIVHLYDQRREAVDTSLRVIGNPTGESQRGSIPSAQSSETEEQTLSYVEREIANQARSEREGAHFSQTGPQRADVSQYTQVAPGVPAGATGGQPVAPGYSGTLAPSVYGGAQPLPAPAEQANPQPQQIGPYLGAYSNEPATLGQNLEQPPLEVGQVPINQEVSNASQMARQLEVDPVAFVNFLRDHTVSVEGAIGNSGDYFVGPDADISSILLAAGGLQRWANRSNLEVIETEVDPNTGTSRTERRVVSLADASASRFVVSPGDDVRVNRVFTDVGMGAATVEGQVRDTGTFQITRGEHLSDLLMRAGGLTGTAYPYGTVFLRKSIAAQEEGIYQREAQEIENQLVMALSRRSATEKLSPDAFSALQGYVNQVRSQKALGRVTVIADPAVLAAHPSEDPLLEPGDYVYVPPRPYSVSVLGEVLQPGSVPFNPSLSAADYIDRAGGYSQFANDDVAIVVLPDGSARRVDNSWLNFGGQAIPPGSTIYVPRDISGLDLHQIIIDTTQIFSQLAVSAASLAVLSRNN